MQPDDRHLAQLNIGRLRHDPHDPRVADFMQALDLVNGIGRRSPGFVWMMTGSGEPNTGNTENAIRGDVRAITNLTVWEDPASLEHFVWNTVHRRFYERWAEWFELMGDQHLVLWWVPVGHRPGLDEALGRLAHLKAHGDTDHAFGWSHLKDARLWKTHGCAQVAAE